MKASSVDLTKLGDKELLEFIRHAWAYLITLAYTDKDITEAEQLITICYNECDRRNRLDIFVEAMEKEDNANKDT